MNIVSRIPTELARERVAWSPFAPHALPAGREAASANATVQGVVVQPPHESKVSVRVEIVTDAERRQRDLPPQPDAESSRDPSESSSRWFANVVDLPPSAAARLGAPDLHQAAMAYRAHADWQPYAGPSGASGSAEPARRLSVRA